MLSLYQKNCNQSFTEIAENVSSEIEKLTVSCLFADPKEIVDPVIQRNSLFAYIENILIAMITDDTRACPRA